MQKYFLGSKSLKKSTEVYQASLERKEKLKESPASGKKTATEKLLNETFNSAASTPVAAGSQTLPSTKPQTIPTSVGYDKMSNASSVEINEPVEYSTTIGSTNKTSNLDSAKTLSGSNGVSLVMTNSEENREPASSSSPSVNGPTRLEAQEATTENKYVSSRNSTVVTTENSTSFMTVRSLSEKLGFSQDQKKSIIATDSSDAKMVPMEVTNKTNDNMATTGIPPNGTL